MEIDKLESRVAIIVSSAVMALGITACGKNDDPIKIPESAIELGTVNSQGDATNGSDLAFLFNREDREDLERVDCGGDKKDVEIRKNGDAIVTCHNASKDELITIK